jgi:hypothetical protein
MTISLICVRCDQVWKPLVFLAVAYLVRLGICGDAKRGGYISILICFVQIASSQTLLTFHMLWKVGLTCFVVDYLVVRSYVSEKSDEIENVPPIPGTESTDFIRARFSMGLAKPANLNICRLILWHLWPIGSGDTDTFASWSLIINLRVRRFNLSTAKNQSPIYRYHLPTAAQHLAADKWVTAPIHQLFYTMLRPPFRRWLSKL